MTLAQMKTKFKQFLRDIIFRDQDNKYNALIRDLVAMGVHPNSVAIIAEYQTLVDSLISGIAVIDSATTKTQLKDRARTILDLRSDGHKYKDIFGPGDLIP